jgi:K(+)-stimulated pyrophosphate-energized sodium pump
MLPGIFWIVPIAAVITIIFAIFLIRNVMKRPTGTPKMKEIGDIIFQGAWAFLKRQYSTIAMYSVGIAIIIGVLVGVLGGTEVK